MIIEGLYNSGYEKEAADIFIRLMNSVSANLKKEKTFRRFYNAEKDTASAEANIISGLPSVSLFIHLLGLRLISSWKLEVHGFNPFPWPVEIKFRGLQIISLSDHIKIKFPNGKEKVILDPSPCIVEISP